MEEVTYIFCDLYMMKATEILNALCYKVIMFLIEIHCIQG